MLTEINLSGAIPRPIPTVGLPKVPTTITATTTSSSNSNTKLSNKLPSPKPSHHSPSNSPPDPNKPIINPITNRKSYDHITDRELRKKLKNRESAQAARDRKKAKMLGLERQLADMAERNKLLENENRELRGRIQRMEAEAFWRLVKNPADANMAENPMAAMMNQGMHPSGMSHPVVGSHAQPMDTTHGQPDLHQIQISEQQKLYQRQMQFLLEGNQAAAAAFHGQIPNGGSINPQITLPPLTGQSTNTSSTSSSKPSQSSSRDSETIELGINFPSLRLPTKGEPVDDDLLEEISAGGRHLSHTSEGAPVNSDGLDDWILRNFKGETSPGKTNSTGYSSADCDSTEGSQSGGPSSPESVDQINLSPVNFEYTGKMPGNWPGNRSASTDSGTFSECTFAAKFPFKSDK